MPRLPDLPQIIFEYAKNNPFASMVTRNKEGGFVGKLQDSKYPNDYAEEIKKGPAIFLERLNALSDRMKKAGYPNTDPSDIINHGDVNGDTALLKAFYAVDVSAIVTLIAGGADVNVANDKGVSPAGIISGIEDSKIKERLTGLIEKVEEKVTLRDMPELIEEPRSSPGRVSAVNLTTGRDATIPLGASHNQ